MRMTCLLLALALLIGLAAPVLAEKNPVLYPVRIKGRWGYIDRTGKLVIEARFVSAEKFSDGRGLVQIAVEDQSKFGFIDETGEFAIEPVYGYARSFSEGLAYVDPGYTGQDVKDGRIHYIDRDGVVIIPGPFQYGSDCREGFVLAGRVLGEPEEVYDRQGNLLLDLTEQSVIEHVMNFSDGLARFETEDGSGYLNTKFEVVIPADYEWSSKPFHEGYAFVIRKGWSRGWDIIDRQGNAVFRSEDWENVGFFDRFSEGLMAGGVYGDWNGSKSGYVDINGEWVIEPQYDLARRFNDGKALVRKGDRLSIIDRENQRLADFSLPGVPSDEIGLGVIEDGIAQLYVGEYWVSLDQDARITGASHPKYDWNGHRYNFARMSEDGEVNFEPLEGQGEQLFPDGVILTLKGPEETSPGGAAADWGAINFDGETVIPFDYDDPFFFEEGLALVRIRDKWGFIDKTGEVRIPLEYDEAFEFSEDLARVKKNGKWGFIDREGEVVVPLEYDDALDFSQGLAAVSRRGKWGFITRKDIFVIEPRFADAQSFSEDLAAVVAEGKWGYINRLGSFTVEPEYEFAAPFSQGVAAVGNYSKGIASNHKEEQWELPWPRDWFMVRSEATYVWDYNPDWSMKFISQQGKTVISDNRYLICGSFSDGYAPIYWKGPCMLEWDQAHWDYIGLNGKPATENHFSSIRQFLDGRAWAIQSGTVAYINDKGDVIWQPSY